MGMFYEMGFDTDLGIDAPKYLDNEKNWKNGIHYGRNDEKYKIKDMTTQHLINTIEYFKGSDISPLERELKTRNYL